MSDRERGYAHRVDIVADASRVWQALTQEPLLRLWCSPAAQVGARQGGLFRASVDRVSDFEAYIDVFEPERRLRLVHLPSGTLPPASAVMVDDFILDRVAGGTIVRLLGSGVPATPQWDTHYLRLRASWAQALQRLKVIVEQKGGAPS
jgi:uncharacterized protein YndB with AHSA1/START domain